MTIHEALDQYRVKQGMSPAEIYDCSKQFKQMLESLEHAGNGWRYVVWASYKAMSHTHPDELERVWSEWNIHTVEDVQAFAQSMNPINVDKFIEDVDYPPQVDINLDELTDIRNVHLANMVSQYCNTTTHLELDVADPVYKLLRDSDLQQLVTKSKFNQLPYRTNTRDCDDFARMFKAWLGFMGLGTLAVGYVEMHLIYSDGHQSGHAVNLALMEDGVKMIEPQSNQVWNPKKPEAGFSGLVEQRIYKVMF